MDKIHVYETKAINSPLTHNSLGDSFALQSQPAFQPQRKFHCTKVQDLMSKQQIVASSPSRNQLEKKQIFKQVHASLARAQKIRISHKKFALFTCNFKRT
jgi:hypothetical protein